VPASAGISRRAARFGRNNGGLGGDGDAVIGLEAGVGSGEGEEDALKSPKPMLLLLLKTLMLDESPERVVARSHV
jgi:hypothetical protein